MIRGRSAGGAKSHVKNCFAGLLIFALTMLCPIIFWTTACGGETDSISKIPSGNVLILNSYHRGFHWSDREQSLIVKELHRNKLDDQPVIEYMDCRHYSGGKYLDQLRALYREKYHGRKFSLVVALDDPAFIFAIKYHAELFGEVPIVFCGVGNFREAMLAGDKHVTGIVDKADPAGTIEVMLRLHPHTREILILHDTRPQASQSSKILRRCCPALPGVSGSDSTTTWYWMT